MKKILALLFMTLSISSLYCAKILDMGYLNARGFVSHVCELTVSLSESLMPFNMTCDEVQPGNDMTVEPGMKIGTWSVFADYPHLEISFSVSPLSLDEDEIEYYLQFAYPLSHGSSSSYLLKPVPSSNIEVTMDLGYLYHDSYISIMESPIYVMMADDRDTLENSDFESGTYTSNVTIRLTAND